MPTDGQIFLQLLPTISYSTVGAVTWQTIGPSQYYTGLYFDYSYMAKGGTSDSVLNAVVYVGFCSTNTCVNWTKAIIETPSSYGGFPDIKVQKRGEYMAVPNDLPPNTTFGISANVTRGTFTFEIDNIRTVSKWQYGPFGQ